MKLVMTADEFTRMEKDYKEDDSGDALEIWRDQAGKAFLLVSLNHWQPTIEIEIIQEKKCKHGYTPEYCLACNHPRK